MNAIVGLLIIVCTIACVGKEGPMGPQGEQGPRGVTGSTANIDRLEAKVDSIESLLIYVLGGTPSKEKPLRLGGETTFEFVPNSLAKDYANFVTDTKIYGELANTGNFDAIDVNIFFRFRSSTGVALLDKSISIGTIRSGKSQIFTFIIDGLPKRYTEANYTITYSGGTELTGMIKLSKI